MLAPAEPRKSLASATMGVLKKLRSDDNVLGSGEASRIEDVVLKCVSENELEVSEFLTHILGTDGRTLNKEVRQVLLQMRRREGARAELLDTVHTLVRDSSYGPQAGWHPGLFQLKLSGDPSNNDVRIAHIDRPYLRMPSKGDQRGSLRPGDVVLKMNGRWICDFGTLEEVQAFVRAQPRFIE